MNNPFKLSTYIALILISALMTSLVDASDVI